MSRTSKGLNTPCVDSFDLAADRVRDRMGWRMTTWEMKGGRGRGR